MISDVGWLNIIAIIGILSFGCGFGLFFIYKARTTKTKLLLVMGLAIFFHGLWYWGNFWESLTLLFTGKNFDNVNGIAIPYNVQAIMSFVWVPVSSILYLYVAASIITPKIKWYIISFMLFLVILWELSLFLSPFDSLSIYIPAEPNSDLVDEDLILGSPISQITTIYLMFVIFFMGIGYLIKSRKRKDILKKKYLFLSIGNFLAAFFSILEGFGATGVILFFTRIGFVLIFWLSYLGLREEQVKVKMVSTDKDVEIEDSIFRIKRRPEQITEQEVTYFREQKICLICKGKVGGFNTYICTKCDALYHEDCARALSNQENACWACNEPIDKSRPSQPFDLKTEPEKAEKLVKKNKNNNSI